MKDPYAILGIARDASDDDVRKAFRQLASKYHPDKNPEDPKAETAFKEVNEAYQVLSDPAKRARYDVFGSETAQSGGVRPRAWNVPEAGPIADIMEELLRQTRIRTKRTMTDNPEEQRQRPGEDLETILEITLEEAANGCRKTVVAKSARANSKCGGCGGLGGAPGAPVNTCASCNGRGKTPDFRVGPGPGLKPCTSCRGRGHSVLVPCPVCAGSGHVQFRRELVVRIPPGIDTGGKLRLAGQGTPGHGLPPGDVYVIVRVLPHDRFERKGRDLTCRVRVDVFDLIEGTSAWVRRLDGTELEVPIPPGFNQESGVKVPGEGLRGMADESRGDLIVNVQFIMPERLTARATALLRELREELREG